MTTHLLIIDPQNDFCDIPETDLPPGERPALPVAGADADMQRLAAFIDANTARLDAITVTLDSHHRLDIAHPTFWQSGEGGVVAPFTVIEPADVRAGRFNPRDPDAKGRVLAYLDALDANGRYKLIVWPVHCEIGTWGQNVHRAVRDAYDAWEESRQRIVAKVGKGSNPWTEHYSAVMAEVPDPDDPGTQMNRALIDRVAAADRLLVAGEASSHCVKATVEHIVANLPREAARRITLLTDCMSPVGGFEANAQAFLADMRAKGVRTAAAAEAFAV